MQTSTTTIIIQTSSRCDESSSPSVYVVISELIDGRTANGEYFMIVGAYRDEAAAERRAEAERAGGNWGCFVPEAECSECGWALRVEAVEVSD
jgi:hypothetical protein